MTYSIEKSLLIDPLSTNNAIYRGSSILTGLETLKNYAFIVGNISRSFRYDQSYDIKSLKWSLRQKFRKQFLFYYFLVLFFRNSRSKGICRLRVLKGFVNSQEDTYNSVLFYKRCFPYNFMNFFRIPFLQNTSGRLRLCIFLYLDLKQRFAGKCKACNKLLIHSKYVNNGKIKIRYAHRFLRNILCGRSMRFLFPLKSLGFLMMSRRKEGIIRIPVSSTAQKWSSPWISFLVDVT